MRALRLLALAVLLSMACGALHDVSQAWDVWYYHLPFAARLAGIVPADAFAFHPANQARFDGFPLLGERLQGALWRLTGRPESANLVAFASVPIFAWFLRRRFDVPAHLTLLALFAVPLVQAHASSSYVDLPANVAASALVLLAIDLHARPPPGGAAGAQADLAPMDALLWRAGLAAAIAANMKALLEPVVLVALVAIGARVVPALLRELRGPARGRALGRVALIVLGLALVFATPLDNLVSHGNPFYPVRVTLLGHALPGVDDPYAYAPPWLEHAPRPLRFGASLLEIGIRPLTDPRRWTVDQWMPSDSTGARLGGFFGAYVVVHVALFAWKVVRDRSRKARVAGAAFAILTVLTSLMPQSHELRYYLYWMIVLVSLNLWFAGSSRALGLVSALALIVVIVVTRGSYAYPSGATFDELLREKVDDAALSRVQGGERVCVRHAPYNLLWAAPFHRPLRYAVQEAEAPEDCAGARPVD